MFNLLLQHMRSHAAAWIVGATVLFCTFIGTALTFLNGNVWLNFVASYAIGMTCMSTQFWVQKNRPPSWNREFVTVSSAIVSLVLGLLLGGTLGAFDPLFFFRTDVTGLVVGGVACFVAVLLSLLMGHLRDVEAERDAARRQELIKERELAVAQLRMLQAQIEPHFLYNTLANVQSLIDTNPTRANELLDALAQLFRVSLSYARETIGSVGEELELISNYLTVQQIRLGDRLNYEIDCEPGLKNREMPPFLLQPLVENAIKHGIEAVSQPGFVAIEAAAMNGTLRIAVANSGPYQAKDPESGVGLANVQARLASIYGESAQLEIDQSSANETRISITLPDELSVA